MKKIILSTLLLISIPFSVACSNIPDAAVSAQPNHSTVEPAALVLENTPGAAAVTGILSDQETTDLLYMREEEKLAHDVYINLYDKWGLPVFSNIASSESTHTASVLTLLNRYGIADPALGLAEGQFQNADLQALYDTLTKQGSLSLGDALKVGAAIEEIDILDLQDTIANTTQADIRLVYENLLAGSSNHLRAFVNTLQQTGETYQPQYLSAEEYQAILAGANSNGMGYGAQGQPGGRGQRGPNGN
ncbi:DUF2202 domain-containing protein [Pelolinea submarina]|uniref:DUF2202 domain-containing protein n=1 Tax=Pelolinea submarina TaxID=913107 RepID=A0A347ZP80_9CHLR|nr:DUF2202 domain-containing protein [Pelolinea submarina]REG08712.1 hypothetical protein DFR64_2087 [Pelolinea submarina]BBB47111.1 hypothetical protein Pelsub_P0338 [Pelolinea submarina]